MHARMRLPVLLSKDLWLEHTPQAFSAPSTVVPAQDIESFVTLRMQERCCRPPILVKLASGTRISFLPDPFHSSFHFSLSLYSAEILPSAAEREIRGFD